ncbi:MAG: hypothetical protein P8X74_18020 [Reinekea sp.]
MIRTPISTVSTARALNRSWLLLLALAGIALIWADIHIYQVDPWAELGRMLGGLLLPHWEDVTTLWQAVGYTLSFALLAIALSAPLGLLLAMMFRFRLVRHVCAAVRSVHELFWGLILMQVYGLSATTGLLAIAVPFTGVFAKVFAEIFAQQSTDPATTLGVKVNGLKRYAYSLIPQSWPALTSYIRYRFECALRSSAILGFIGLPTLGFHLETMFKQGHYAQAGALLWVFFVLIATLKYWLRPKLLPLYLIAAIFLLPDTIGFSNSGYFWQFISHDIWPKALREGNWLSAWHWYADLFHGQIWQGVVQTLMLTQIALMLTLALVLLLYPLASRRLSGPWLSRAGKCLLLVFRSTPEMMLAFIFLLQFGPSGLPAIIALALHNGSLIAFLTGRASDAEPEHLHQRPDDPTGLLYYAYIETPRRFPALLALLFYRWELILRESAIMGILGITTLGFYIDSAFEEFRFDRAFVLIVVTAALNIAVDGLSRWLRRR